MDLLLLAPDIQERVLFLESVDGRELFGERALRRLLAAEGWAGSGVNSGISAPKPT